MDCQRPMKPTARNMRDEKGLALIHVGIALFVLIAMSAFVLDFGVMWLARRQAQNAADAGALAGAIARAFDETVDEPAADGVTYQSAVAAAEANEVFGEEGGVRVTWECPDYVDEDSKCVRVDVHRDGLDVDADGTTDSNSLPVYFASLFGLSSQPVRATATAWVGIGNATDCMKPFAIPDFYQGGIDNYSAPGYTLEDHLGTIINIFKSPGGVGQDGALSESSGWYRIIDVMSDGGGGANETRASIKSCSADVYAVDDTLPDENQQNGVEATIKDAIKDLHELDPDAYWDETEKKVKNSCAENRSCMKWELDGNKWVKVPDPGRSYSPRVMAMPIFDPVVYQTTGAIQIVNIFGFFLLDPDDGYPLPNPPALEIWGAIVNEPGLLTSGGGDIPEEAAFVQIIQLIR